MNNFARFICLVTIAFNLAVNNGLAQDEIVQFDNPNHKALYDKLIKELRCLVCQNQNLADSNADLAKDLRDKSYEMVTAGKHYKEIIEYMTDRYGEFILYRPRVLPSTFLLWFAPFILFASVVFFTVKNTSKNKSTDTRTYSAEQLRQAKQLLDTDSDS